MRTYAKILGFLCLPAAIPAFAAGEFETGAEYQINFTHSDDGLNDKAAIETSALNLKGAKFSLKGKLSDQISWTVLYKAKEGELERYFLTNKVSDNLDLTIGKQKIKVYGLHRKLASSTTSPLVASMLSLNPLTDKLAIDLTYKIAGTVSLQLVEDYSKCSDTDSYTVNGTNVTKATTTKCTSWNSGSSTPVVANSKDGTTKQKQPAVAFEWYGAFDAFSPIVQYSLYDLGKSSTASAGLRYKKDGLDTYLDYVIDSRNAKGIDSNGKSVEEKTTYSGFVAYAEYKVSQYTPYLHVSSFATDPYLKPAATEVEKTAAEANKKGSLDRNEMTVAIGSHFDQWGAYYRPFVHVAIAQGEFVDADDASKKKSLTRTDVVAGLIGKF